jgi:hypothetical protein
MTNRVSRIRTDASWFGVFSERARWHHGCRGQLSDLIAAVGLEVTEAPCHFTTGKFDWQLGRFLPAPARHAAMSASSTNGWASFGIGSKAESDAGPAR